MVSKWLGDACAGRNLQYIPFWPAATKRCGLRLGDTLRTGVRVTHLGLQITINHVEAVQIGEGEYYLRRVELPLVVGKPASSETQTTKKHHGSSWQVF